MLLVEPLRLRGRVALCVLRSGAFARLERRWNQAAARLASPLTKALLKWCAPSASRADTPAGVDPIAAVVEKTPFFIAIADADGRLLYLNAAGRSLMGLAPVAAIDALTLAQCHAPEMRPVLRDRALPQAARCGMWTGPSVFLDERGRRRPTHLTLIAHRDPRGELQSYSAHAAITALGVAPPAIPACRALQSLTAQHVSIRESERRAVALDLHDSLGQSLNLLKLSMREAARLVERRELPDPPMVLRNLAGTVEELIGEVRRIAMGLRPSMLDDLGLLPTFSWYLRELEASGAGIRVQRSIRLTEAEIPENLKIGIYRILQEATSNAVRHGRASRLHILLYRDEAGLHFEVEDDGRGFDVEAVRGMRGRQGLGLNGMVERAQADGGRCDIESSKGCGTSVRVTWPLAATAESPGRLCGAYGCGSVSENCVSLAS